MLIEGVKGEGARSGNGVQSPMKRERNLGAASPRAVERIGIWVQGVDRLGAAYEGIWRVIKRFILSSEGSGKRFCFAAPARFRKEIEEFLSDLPDSLRECVGIEPFGRSSDTFEQEEAARQAIHANQLDVDAWLVPNPMWGAAKHLVRPKIVWFHDFLLVEFPQSYPRTMFLEFQEHVRGLADAGAFFIFTSPYVKEKHGHEFCGIPTSQSTLILNPPIDGMTALEGVPEDPDEAADFLRSELKENLRDWCSGAHAELFYHHISSYPFERNPYFFVSSQNREHKGFLRLAQAHATLLRERYLPYSIFTTALVDVAGSSPLERYLKAELLLGDFMSVGKVSDAAHALLYKFARVTLHPSTFEGNLPLPFAESVSVGTPCIMPYSRAFRDYVEPDMHPWVFFNPTQAGIIEKIEEVDARRKDFLAAQKHVLRTLQRHTLKDFFALHLRAMDDAARIAPRAAEYLISATHNDEQVPQKRGLFRDALKSATHFGSSNGIVQARIWEPFSLTPSVEIEGRVAVLHWAAYLGSGHPKGDSYFVLSVDSDSSSDVGDLDLVAELGAWIDDSYEVADNQRLTFDDLAGLPSDLRETLDQGGLLQIGGHDVRYGWTKLSWKRGAVPEIRIGGRAFEGSVPVIARLASATRIRKLETIGHG